MDEHIARSHSRCTQYGLLPHILPTPQISLSPSALTQIKRKYREVLDVVHLFGEKTIELLRGTSIVMMVTDHEGRIIEMFGDESMAGQMAVFGIKEGVKFEERVMGTSAISLALTHNMPFHLSGNDHFHEALYPSSCCSVPFTFKEFDQLSGTITLMSTYDNRSSYQLAFLVNMVESVERELLLRRNNKKMALLGHLLMGNIDTAVIVCEPDGRIVDFNRAAESLLRCKREEIIGTPITGLRSIGDILLRVLHHGEKASNREVTLSFGMNDQAVCLLDAMQIVDDTLGFIGCYVQLKDITERQTLITQLITSEKLSVVGRLAAGLAHEIRNPLTTINGFVQLMLQRTSRDHNADPNREYMELIYEELQNVTKLVSDFVVCAKPSSPEFRRCDINLLIEETVRLMQPQAHMKNCRITCRCDSSDMEIRVDPSQIKQVMINLIQNAIDAIPIGGTVVIITGVQAADSMLRISVTDTGIGMTEEELKQISHPFFTTKDNGVGLGLSICYRIVESHHGTILVSSEKGHGTRFDVLLPIS